MAERPTGRYSGLSGVAGSLDGTMTSSPHGVLYRLKYDRVTSAAGDHGAITAWIDDAGIYRASFCRNLVERASTSSKTQAGLIRWLQAWWPAMSHPCYTPEEPAHV